MRLPFPSRLLHTIRWFGAAVTLVAACLLGIGYSAGESTRIPRSHRLFNGWGLSPVGRPIPLPGDFPARILVSRDRRHLFANSIGFNEHGAYVIDLKDQRVIQQVDLGKSWTGMALTNDERQLLVSGGGPMPPQPTYWGVRLGFSSADRERLNFPIYLLGWRDGKLAFDKGIHLPGNDGKKRFIAGISTAPDGSILVIDFENNELLKLRPDTFEATAAVTVGYRPYAVSVSPDGRTAAVSNWGGGSVSLVDLQSFTETVRPGVGRSPNELTWEADGRLFVANAGSDSVSVISGSRVIETIPVSLSRTAPAGSTPDAVALSPSGQLLFVSNANNDDVAVIDVSHREKSVVKGFIPTAWYPGALAMSADGRRLYIGIAKGLGSGPNIPYVRPPARLGRTPENLLDNPKRNATAYNYIGGLLRGFIYSLPVPNPRELAAMTQAVEANTPIAADDNSLQARQAVFSRIQHVLYIIRENRTYDQVLGDMPQGNGDPKLVLFGRRITANAHRLAERYVLLDNLYANGEVSQDGHSWCDSAYATDFMQKAWMYRYSGRGDLDQDGRLSASPGGTIWKLAGQHGLDYRNYGEGNDRPDAAWTRISGDFFEVRDTNRAKAFVDELADAQKTGIWPQLMVMSLPTDHTQGLLPGAYSPIADVADNDLALGRIVEAISHSRFWKNTVIFVVEDDAQDGPDHVDSHRTVGLAISPFIRRHAVDHTQYTQASIVRTIELILGLPAMTQFDSAATPLTKVFTDTPEFDPYDAVAPQVDMSARNPREGTDASASLKLDFSEPDRADPRLLNAILWRALRSGEKEPVSVRGLFSRQTPRADDDDR